MDPLPTKVDLINRGHVVESNIGDIIAANARPASRHERS